MNEGPAPGDGRVVAFIDIGTNSVRLLVVRIGPLRAVTVLTRRKQQVRLGEGEFPEGEILPEAMDRALVVCRTFMDLARSYAADEFVAVATSATREAANRNEFLSRLRHEAQLDVQVISGREEARLIYLGVAGGTNLGEEQALFIDIGGGSTEIAIGDRLRYQYLESLKLGAVRLTNRYFGSREIGPVVPRQYGQIREEARAAALPAVLKIQRYRIDRAIGSSGTILNLAEIARNTRRRNGDRQAAVLTHRDLRKVVGLLCSLPLEARRRVPGINPDRADIIIAGAAILDALMGELRIRSISLTDRGLQEGLLADYLSRMGEFPLFGDLSVRQRSILQLGRSCGINEAHARTVTALALGLFDSAQALGLHRFGQAERELLEYATFLHDIGSFISYTNHHAHSFYIISNADLPGFDRREAAVMAAVARFHRKKAPHRKAAGMAGLGDGDRETVRILSIFLRLAERLDRSHAALVRKAGFSRADKAAVVLEIAARGDCRPDLWDAEEEQRAFSKVFGRRILFAVVRDPPGPIA